MRVSDSVNELGIFLLSIFAYVILFIVIIMIIKIIFQYRKYGKKIFKIYKKHDKVSTIDLIKPLIDKMNGYKKIVMIKNGLILVNSYGISVIVALKYDSGRIEGNLTDEKWLITTKDQIKIEIDNPFIIKENITPFMVSHYRTTYKLYGVKTVTIESLLFFLEKNDTPIYDAKQIDELYEKVKVYGSD